MQVVLHEKAFENPVNEDAENIENEEGIFFNPTEWKYFKLEIEDMINSDREFSFKKAVHNARYLAEIDRRSKDIEAGKNCKTFTAEEWEAFVNGQDLS
ncbi:MAG: hypothetical protein IJT73_05485 [Selenomonadaceae bacterium]|nr:hypothetical protein [Selenomonadaceae bacterium]